jgi:hypothetical protein
MRSINKYIVLPVMLLSILAHTSCSKNFLDVETKGLQVAKTTQDYRLILNTYNLLTQFNAGSYAGDEVAVQQQYFENANLRLQRIFKYEDVIYDDSQLPDELVSTTSYIRGIYILNSVINEVMESQGGTDQEKKEIQAEAKALRAVCHFMFASDFSLPYNEATAGTEPGIPIITKADVTERSFTRATIKETYDFITNDLKEALPYLGVLEHRRKMSKLAAEFYLGRVYLSMGKFNEARDHVNAAFQELSKAQIQIALYDYNVVLDPAGTATWFPDSEFGFMNKPNDANFVQTFYNITSTMFEFNSANAFVYSPHTASLFTATDKRVSLYSGRELFGTFIFPKQTRRFPFFFMEIGPSLPDLYLMRAELSARNNQLQQAVNDLETLRKNRMSTSDATVPAEIASNQEKLVRFVFDERIREFALTGLRWLDMRRLSVDPTYKDNVDFIHEMIDDDGNVVATYTLRPERFAMKFGARMIAENTGLTENK